jgi:hypothetical protein
MPRLDLTKLQNDEATVDKILKYATEFYKFEIENFWKRSVFFWGFIAVAFVAYAAAYDKDKTGRVLLLISAFGLLSSVAWTLLNRGSKYWYEAWEQKVSSAEMCLKAPLFSNIEPLIQRGWLGSANFSVSKLTIALSDLSVIAWVALGANAMTVAPACYSMVAATITALLGIIGAALAKSDAREKVRHVPPQSN